MQHCCITYSVHVDATLFYSKKLYEIIHFFLQKEFEFTICIFIQTSSARRMDIYMFTYQHQEKIHKIASTRTKARQRR